jgi:hypothetical protein
MNKLLISRAVLTALLFAKTPANMDKQKPYADVWVAFLQSLLEIMKDAEITFADTKVVGRLSCSLAYPCEHLLRVDGTI